MEWWWLYGWTAVVVLVFKSKFLDGRRRRKEEAEEGGRRGRVPEGSSGWPLIGETLNFIASGYSSRPVSFMDTRKSLYGEVFKTHLLGKPVIVSTDPEVNKVVLQNHGNCFVPSYPKSVAELFGESSILSMDGPLHRKVHASIGRFFKSSELKSRIVHEVESSIKLSLATWLDRPHPILVQDETKQITFEILVKMLMSVGPGEDLDLIKREYREFIKGLVCVPVKLPGTQLYKSLKAKKRLLEVTKKIVEERKSRNMGAVKADNSGVAKDAVEMLLSEVVGNSGDDCEQGLPMEFICSNIIEMMIPGEDSVPMIMTLAVKFLSDNPVALARLLEENMELKRQKMGSSISCYHWTDYMSLAFTQHVISETLRMANIINAVWRQATKDVEIKGYLIPKGWCVMASITSVHMDGQNYENPYDFDPWRWEKKGSPTNFSHTFTPFGGGQRLCPGADLARLEIAIFLHHLVTTYSWVAEKDEIVYFPTVKMKRKLPIAVVPSALKQPYGEEQRI